tara:strand:- start:1338 stop:1658 length:321 start_codon:yes stop_codon:yes gene_type:complete
MTRRYLPNNWQQYKDAPDDMFIDHTYEEFFDWKVNGWQLPSSVVCILRVEDPNTGQIKEHTYQRMGAAKRRIDSIMKEGKKNLVICDVEAIHNLKVKPPDTYSMEQ